MAKPLQRRCDHGTPLSAEDHALDAHALQLIELRRCVDA
jgi:hypothetical protein